MILRLVLFVATVITTAAGLPGLALAQKALTVQEALLRPKLCLRLQRGAGCGAGAGWPGNGGGGTGARWRGER